MHVLSKFTEFGARLVCASLLVGACLWIAGTMADVTDR